MVFSIFLLFGPPLNIYGSDKEYFFTTNTGDKVKVFNSPLQDDISCVVTGGNI